MLCHEAPYWLRWFKRKMIEEKFALEGALFYADLMGYSQDDRDDLLDFQMVPCNALVPCVPA